MLDCIGYCTSPKAPTFGDWRFAYRDPLEHEVKPPITTNPLLLWPYGGEIVTRENFIQATG